MCKIKYLLTLCVITTITMCGIVSSLESEYLNFVKLVTDFRRKYGAINILIAQSEKYDEFKVATTFTSMMRRFSQNNVFTTITRIADLPLRISYYDKKIDRPFFVIVIATKADLDAFIHVTKTVNMNLYQMLIIFNQALADICEKPKGNLFNLAFNSYMVVRCQGDPILREWFSLYQNTTEISDLVYWKPNVFEWLTDLGLKERRKSLHGLSFRITMTENSKLENGKPTDFFGNLFYEISNSADFNLDLQPYEDMPGSYDPDTKEWTGVMRKLYENKTDIGLSAFSITQERLNIVDFSDPIYVSISNFYIRKSHVSHVLWSMYYKAFGLKAFYCFLAFLLGSPIILSLTTFNGSFGYTKSKGDSFYKNLYENYFIIWGIFCLKPLIEFPDRSSARIICYSLYILSFILYSTYSALLVSYLTIFKPTLPFNSLDEFIAAKTHKITTIKNTSYIDLFKLSKHEYVKRLSDFLLPDEELPDSLEGALDQVCDTHKKVVLYVDEILLRDNKLKIPCEIIPFERGRLVSLAMAFTKGSPYVDVINFHLQRMRNFGLMNAMKHRNLRKFQADSSTIYKAVTIWSTLPIFGILGGGMLLSIIILICEIIIFHVNHKKNKVIHSTAKQTFIEKKDVKY